MQPTIWCFERGYNNVYRQHTVFRGRAGTKYKGQNAYSCTLVLLHTINMRNVASTLMLFYVVHSRVLVT